MQNKNPASTPDQGFRGGLVAALVVFALTWFVVNGAEVAHDDFGARATGGPAVCTVPENIPTSRFLKSPLPAPVPWAGG